MSVASNILRKTAKSFPKSTTKSTARRAVKGSKRVKKKLNDLPPEGRPKVKLTPQQQLDKFLEDEQIKDFKTTTLTIKGKKVKVALSPYSTEELKEKVQTLIDLRQAANPNVAQPRRGWQQIFGNNLGEDGWPIDFGGGRRTTSSKKGSSKPLYIRSTKNANERHFRETAWPVDQRHLAERRKYRDVTDKHHIYHLIGSIPFAMRRDASGKLVKRSTEQLERVAATLRKQDGIYVGDQDWNEVMLSKKAHTGLKSDPITTEFSAHSSVYGDTDIGGAPLKDGKRTEVFEGGHTLPGTYEPGQGHGFSKEFLEKLYKLETDEEVIRAIRGYYDIQSEPLKGSASVARRVIDEPRGVVQDPMSAKIHAQNLPEEKAWTEAQKKLPQKQEYLPELERADYSRATEEIKKVGVGGKGRILPLSQF